MVLISSWFLLKSSNSILRSGDSLRGAEFGLRVLPSDINALGTLGLRMGELESWILKITLCFSLNVLVD